MYDDIKELCSTFTPKYEYLEYFFARQVILFLNSIKDEFFHQLK